MPLSDDLPRLILPMIEGATRETPISLIEIRCELEFDKDIEASERQIKAAIQTLCQQGYPIGARRQTPHGYYLCRSVDEFKEAFAPRRRQAITMLVTIRKARRKMSEMAGQMRLEVGA